MLLFSIRLCKIKVAWFFTLIRFSSKNFVIDTREESVESYLRCKSIPTFQYGGVGGENI